MSCAEASMASTRPVLIPFDFNILLKSSAVPRPQSLFTTRKSTFLMPILFTIFAKAAASTSEGGAMRKI